MAFGGNAGAHRAFPCQIDQPLPCPTHPACIFLRIFLLIVDLPKKILRLAAISREMTFSSKEQLSNFRIKQVISVYGASPGAASPARAMRWSGVSGFA